MDLKDEDRGSDAAQGLNDSPTMEASPTVTFSSPPIEQRAGNQNQCSDSSVNTACRKRSRRAMADDDLGSEFNKYVKFDTTNQVCAALFDDGAPPAVVPYIERKSGGKWIDR